jgi:hypothetical protein
MIIKNKKLVRYLSPLKPYNLIQNLLALFATIAIGLLSYAGAIAIGFSFSLAITAFLLTVLVSLQVNLEMISEAISKLTNFFKNGQDKLKNILFIIASLLSTISIGATTLLSAVGLFPFSSALLIAGISGLACFFVSFEILCQASELFTTFQEKFAKFNEKLEKRHPLLRAFIRLISILLILSALYYIIATAATWWTETQLGLLLIIPIRVLVTAINVSTSPFAFITHALFSIINPILALFKFSSINTKFNFWNSIKDKPGLVFNPFYLINTALAYTTSFLLFLAHSACHALMAGRTSLVTIAGTIVDFFADANFTIAREHKEESEEGTTTHDHGEHGHEPFDFIVVFTQTIVTLPLQLPAIALTILISLFQSEKTISEAVKESLKENFYFIDQYIASKSEHAHHAHQDDKPKIHPTQTANATHDAALYQTGCIKPITTLRDVSPAKQGNTQNTETTTKPRQAA